MKLLSLVCLFVLVSCNVEKSGGGTGRSTNSITFDEAQLFGTWSTGCAEVPKRMVNVTFNSKGEFVKSTSYHSSVSEGCTAENETMSSSQEATFKTAEKIEGNIYGLDLTNDENEISYYTFKINEDGTLQISNGSTSSPDFRITSFDDAEKLKKQTVE